jgi:hypothetical protein
MVLKVLATAVTAVLPANYYVHALVAIVTIIVIRAFAQGRSTNRERDLHARVILVSVGLAAFGILPQVVDHLVGRVHPYGSQPTP